MRNEIEDAGFVGVVEKVFHVPFGPWPRNPKMRELGKWSLLAFTMGIEGYVLASLTRFMGVSGGPRSFPISFMCR